MRTAGLPFRCRTLTTTRTRSTISRCRAIAANKTSGAGYLVVACKTFFAAGKSAGRGARSSVEFQGARQVAEVYLNGHLLGVSKTGFIPFGFDLTPWLHFEGPNVLAVMYRQPVHEGVRWKPARKMPANKVWARTN